MNADPTSGITTDDLTTATGLDLKQLAKALTDLQALGVLRNDTAITAYVHHRVQNHSQARFQTAADMEQALIHLMQEEAPDQQPGETLPLHLRQTAQRLKDQGHGAALPLLIMRALKSLAQTGTETHGGNANLRTRSVRQETLHVTLNTGWTILAESAAHRRQAARTVLDTLLGKLPQSARGTDLLAETTMGELTDGLRLQGAVTAGTDTSDLLHQALLWLHDQEVIRLNQGLTIVRPAMTIELRDRQRQFLNSDYEPLDIHYAEQTLQVHIMAEYAEKGLTSLADALTLALDYFTLPRDRFEARWTPGKRAQLQRRTTPQSYNRIVESLNNRAQQRTVADDRDSRNTLLLAGPGSGKTTVLVHRIAYLVRVKRENPRSILALAYNRHAAMQIRQRLHDLIGDDASAITVMTCHALAMRMIGRTYQSHAARTDREANRIFESILEEATRHLNGDSAALPEENSELREKLLGSFRWILVDEYQDIKEPEYQLISALAGRTKADDEKLNIFAVGDDDQNIYAWDGSSTEYIRRFQEDYGARPSYMTENYRSTRHIIDAANAVIGGAQNRLKDGYPITVDTVRNLNSPGGAWERLDPVARGRVQVLPAGDDAVTQALAVMQELERMADLDPAWNWSGCAVIARRWETLDPVRAVCESRGIRVQSAQEDFTATWQLRETQGLLAWAAQQGATVDPRQALDRLRTQTRNTWTELLLQAMETCAAEASGNTMTPGEFNEWIAEWARDNRRRQRGLLLTSAHRAKGLEFDHVVILDTDWDARSRNTADPDEQRRIYYVAMTRAKKTLTLARCGHANPFLPALTEHQSVLHRQPPQFLPEPPPETAVRRIHLSLGDVDLSYTGRTALKAAVDAIAEMQPGNPLRVDTSTTPWQLLTPGGVRVGRLSRRGQQRMDGQDPTAQVLAIARWSADSSGPAFRRTLRLTEWEVVIPEIRLTKPGSNTRRS